MRDKIVLFLSTVKAFFQTMQKHTPLNKMVLTQYYLHTITKCLDALNKGSRSTKAVVRMTKLHPWDVTHTLKALTLKGLVEFQPNCDASGKLELVIWRLKPAPEAEIVVNLKGWGPCTIEELSSKFVYPSSAILATLEAMDNVKLIDGKLYLV